MSLYQFNSSTAAGPQRVSNKRTTQDKETSFRGVRKRRWGRYVSEIRLPGQKTRIWLGSFGSAEMAARAYDSAAFFLKGDSAILNFPELMGSLPRPESCSRTDIQSAAAKAALYERRVNRDKGPECMAWWHENGMAAFENDRAGAALPNPMEGELWSFMDHDLDFLTSCFHF